MLGEESVGGWAALAPPVRQALQRLQLMVNGMLDPDNSPAACYVLASEALLKLCQSCIVAQARRWDPMNVPGDEWGVDPDVD
jgi:hypothetical protein